MASANDLSSRGWNLCVAAEAPPSGTTPLTRTAVDEEEGPFRGARCGGGPAAAPAGPPFATSSSMTPAYSVGAAFGGPHPSTIVSAVAVVGGDRGTIGAPETAESLPMPMPMPMPTTRSVGRADWMESLTQACLDRARQFKKKRRRSQPVRQQRLLHRGEAPPQLGLLAGATGAPRLSYLVEAETNDDDDDDNAGTIREEKSSKRRRRRLSHPDEEFQGSFGSDPSLRRAARQTIHDALTEQQRHRHSVKNALEPLHRGANGGTNDSQGNGPQPSQYTMTNEEWLDLLRQVQEELCDDDGASGDYDPLDERIHSEEEEDDDERIERAVEAARAEQAYWDEQAAEWLVEGEGSGGEPGDVWGRPATNQHEYVEDDGDDGSVQVLCPACHEACLTFVASEGDDAAGGTSPRGSLGSIVCPNHLDGSCTMRVDRVPPPRRKALTAMRRLLCELCDVHAAASLRCTHPPEFEVATNDQVLHASCATCGETQSVPLAPWFS